MSYKIERLDHQGRGITYINGKIAFVKDTLPGEEIELKIIKENSKLIEAEPTSFLKESQLRVKELCPYYKECGGCNLLHMSYEEQIKYKQSKIVDVMKKYADINSEVIKQIVPCDRQFHYRNKVTLKVKEKLGYFKEKTYELIPIKKCLLVNDKINEIIKILNGYTDLSSIKEVVIKSFTDKETMLIIYLQEDEINENLLDYLSRHVDNIIVYDNNKKTIKKIGKSNIIARLKEKQFKIGTNSFFQVNMDQTLKIYDKIAEYLSENENSTVLDLYCGVGSIGLYSVSNYAKLIGVEIVPEAIENAKTNAELNSMENTKFLVGDTKTIQMHSNYKADTIIVDPPRAGLDKSVIEDIKKINPNMLIYLSCDPITLARDLKLLSDLYDVEELIPYDMFPNTHHVETLVKLTKK